ncbi:MAG: DUF2341 domain-containing protein [Bacteroidetes bacterium]|nr:DUF2341 domain-containing protein [Bacteroidota bacterium]
MIKIKTFKISRIIIYSFSTCPPEGIVASRCVEYAETNLRCIEPAEMSKCIAHSLPKCRSIYFLFFLTLNILVFTFHCSAQNGGAAINSTGAAANNSAILDVDATNQGVLMPRMTTAQRDLINSPADGLTIYNIDCHNYNYYNGSAWIPLNSIGGSSPATPGTISGSSNFCNGQTGVSYTVSHVSGTTSYTWVVPTGASITSGQGSSAITVTFGSNPGNICVTASNSCGTSSPSCLSVTLNPSPAIPVAIAGTGAAQTQITANWNSASNATGYYLDVATDIVFTSILTNYNNLNVSNVTTYNVTSLSCGTTYYYRVRAYNSCVTSGNSNTTTYSTASCCVCPAMSTWQYKAPWTINNTSNSNTLTNYQVKLTLNTAALVTAGKMLATGNDIRFTDNDQCTLLSYWIESGINTTSTVIWVNIPSIAASSSKTIYMYYGNASAVSASSALNTKIFQLKEHNSNAYTINMLFTKPVSGELRVIEGSSTAGSAEVFLNISRSWLNGKKLKINWKIGNWTTSETGAPASLYITDGAYDRKSGVDFPDGTGKPVKGSGNLFIYSKGTTGPGWSAYDLHTSAALDLSTGTLDECALWIHAYDYWAGSNYPMGYQIDYLQILDGSDNVVWEENFNDEPVMEVTGTNNDYGLFRKYSSPEPSGSIGSEASSCP